jgi:hypothetical protein
MQTQIDHLVVVARTLAQGVASGARPCFGITPGPWRHPRAVSAPTTVLFKVATPTVSPGPTWKSSRSIGLAAAASRLRAGSTWTTRSLQAAVSQRAAAGALWWANTSGYAGKRVRHLAGLQGWTAGLVWRPAGPADQRALDWQITVREDGQRLLDGTLAQR